ncbi:MAG: SIS domain-containing protein [Desulfovibrio sp.]|nr:MAG: SIS domain-containing protein [Desulfovibrio sp.]
MSENAKQMILTYSQQGCELRERFFQDSAELVVEAARTMAVTLARGGKILFCGNGGSAADAQHLAGEFVNRFMLERPPLPAIALTTDTSILTAIGNDYGFKQVFSKQVQALGDQGDVIMAISTSGNSENIIEALRVARDKGLITMGLAGLTGGEMAPLCDQLICVPDKSTPLIQEVQISIGHLLCRLVDYYLFEAVQELQPYMASMGEAPDGN